MDEINFIKKNLHNYKVKAIDIINMGNILNQYTKMIYVINIKNNFIRRNYILTIMKKYEISFKLVIVEKITKETFHLYNKFNNNISIGELGCGLSHLWCLKDIIKNNYKNAIVFEDDIIFHKNFESKFYNIINEKPYDFLLLGARDFHFSEINYKNIVNNLYRPNINYDHVYGAHAIFYSLNAAIYMFKNKLNKFAFFDYNLNKIFSHFKNSSFICSPNLVITELSTSDIDHNYDLFSESEKSFYLKCFKKFNFNDYHFIYLNILHCKHIDKFTSYKNYVAYLFKEKFIKSEYINDFLNRLDLQIFSLEDIKKICTPCFYS